MTINPKEKIRQLLEENGITFTNIEKHIHLNLEEISETLKQENLLIQSILDALPVYIRYRYKGWGEIYYYPNEIKQLLIVKENQNTKRTYITNVLFKNNKPILMIEKTSKSENMLNYLVKSNHQENYLSEKLSPNLNNVQESFYYYDGNAEHLHSTLTTFRDTNSDKVLIQKYKQYRPLGEFCDNPPNLIRLCGTGNRNLEIIYCEDTPLYAELDSDYSLSMLEMNSNSEIAARSCIDQINEEYDLFIDKITHALTNSNVKIKKKRVRKK